MRLKRIVLGIVLLLAGALLAACGCDDGGDVVFVQTGEQPVCSVWVDGPVGGQGVQNVDGTALDRGDSYGFDADEVGWPMKVTAYREPGEKSPLDSVAIPGAPPYGERWFVYFQNGELAYGADWPLER